MQTAKYESLCCICGGRIEEGAQEHSQQNAQGVWIRWHPKGPNCVPLAKDGGAKDPLASIPEGVKVGLRWVAKLPLVSVWGGGQTTEVNSEGLHNFQEAVHDWIAELNKNKTL